MQPARPGQRERLEPTERRGLKDLPGRRVHAELTVRREQRDLPDQSVPPAPPDKRAQLAQSDQLAQPGLTVLLDHKVHRELSVRPEPKVRLDRREPPEQRVITVRQEPKVLPVQLDLLDRPVQAAPRVPSSSSDRAVTLTRQTKLRGPSARVRRHECLPAGTESYS